MVLWNKPVKALNNRLYFLLLVSLMAGSLANSLAQGSNGRVISAENDLWLADVEIRDLDGNITSTTDQNGSFSIKVKGTYTFLKEGYETRTLALDPKKYQVVSLQEETENLTEVLVRMDNFRSSLERVSSSIAILDIKQIQSNSQVNLAPVLQMTPGVYMHNGTLTTNRITIRGIGSRNLFGTSKIRAYYQDIPLTNGSGETSIEDLELSGLVRMEVRKGPSSSQFGAGLGGTILMIPDKGRFDQYNASISSMAGSFGMIRYMLRATLGDKKNSAALTYTDTHSDGYRENNQTDRKNLSLSSNHYLDEKNNLVFIGNYTRLKAFIPSSLGLTDFREDPEQAAFTWASAKGNEDYDRLLLGLSWDHQFNERSKQVSSIFGTYYNAKEDRPFNILEERSFAFGARSRYQSEGRIGKNRLQYTFGGEFFLDRLDYQTFENLYNQFPPGTGSVKGDLLTDLVEDRFYLNIFGDSKLFLNPDWTLDFGINLNQTNYDLADRLKNEEDLSGSYRFETILSPKLGTTYRFNENFMVYASVSHGFSPPKLEETLLPEGRINPDIQPERGWNFEIGSRGSFWKEIMTYGLAAYYMPVKDLLVARRTGDDQFIGVNAGKTILKGVEIELGYLLLNKEKIKISHQNALNLSDHVFDDFQDLDNDYSGNELTGVPNHTFNSQLHLQVKNGFYAYLNYYNAGKIPVNDANNVYADAYQLVNTKLGWRNTLGSSWSLHLYGGLNNLFDEKYSAMLQINARGFGNNEPRYYYPGEPFNYYLGFDLSYTF